MGLSELVPGIHERDLEHPDSFRAVPQETHPVTRAVAHLGSVLCNRYQHRWTREEKGLYRRAIKVAHLPHCPTCAKPMSESVLTVEDQIHKSWYCATCQNL